MEFSGIVQKGRGEGAVFGFPTANIPLAGVDISGVYAGVATLDGKKYQAAIYVDQRRQLLEAHLFDYSDDAYGKEMHVTLGVHIREDEIFATEKEIIEQIAKDVATIRALKPTI